MCGIIMNNAVVQLLGVRMNVQVWVQLCITELLIGQLAIIVDILLDN